MKKESIRVILTLLLFITLIGYAGAYIITIDAPESVIKGSPLIVTGNTTFPESTYFDLVLYYSKYTAGEVARQKVIIDRNQIFRVPFDTKTLDKGQYKVEVHDVVSDNKDFANQQLGSSSILSKIIQIKDRSDEITITSPTNQSINQALLISGRMKNIGNGVLTIRVSGPDQFISGPVQVITTKEFTGNTGDFSTTVEVNSAGDYLVKISDKNGYIGEYSFTVTDTKTSPDNTSMQPVITGEPLATPVETKTNPPTQSEISDGTVTPVVTDAKAASPLSSVVVITAIGLISALISLNRRKH